MAKRSRSTSTCANATHNADASVIIPASGSTYFEALITADQGHVVATANGGAPSNCIPVGADNIGGAYSTKNWVGWPDSSNPYGAMQPTQPNALDVVLHLRPAGS